MSNFFTGIGSRVLRPLLGIVDPLNCMTMPNRVAAFSAFDVFCHALESFTALPYYERSPRPTNPINRPAYQVKTNSGDSCVYLLFIEILV